MTGNLFVLTTSSTGFALTEWNPSGAAQRSAPVFQLPPSSLSISMAVSPSGLLGLVSRDLTGQSTLVLQFSELGPNGWTPAVVIEQLTAYDTLERDGLTYDASGNPFIGYTRRTWNGLNHVYEARVATRASPSSPFNVTTPISFNGGAWNTYDRVVTRLATGWDGVVHVASAKKNWELRHGTWTGSSWMTEHVRWSPADLVGFSADVGSSIGFTLVDTQGAPNGKLIAARRVGSTLVERVVVPMLGPFPYLDGQATAPVAFRQGIFHVAWPESSLLYAIEPGAWQPEAVLAPAPSRVLMFLGPGGAVRFVHPVAISSHWNLAITTNEP